MELEGRAREAHAECSNGLPSFTRFLGPFWAKKGCFGAQNAQFWDGTSRLGPPVSFWLKTWILPGHHLGSRMARVE